MEREKKTKRSADPSDVVQSPAVQVGGSSSSGTANRAPQDEHMDVDDELEVAKKEFIQIVTTSTMIASKINQGNVLVRDGTRR
jgi:hypothetical protein